MPGSPESFILWSGTSAYIQLVTKYGCQGHEQVFEVLGDLRLLLAWVPAAPERAARRACVPRSGVSSEKGQGKLPVTPPGCWDGVATRSPARQGTAAAAFASRRYQNGEEQRSEGRDAARAAHPNAPMTAWFLLRGERLGRDRANRERNIEGGGKTGEEVELGSAALRWNGARSGLKRLRKHNLDIVCP